MKYVSLLAFVGVAVLVVAVADCSTDDISGREAREAERIRAVTAKTLAVRSELERAMETGDALAIEAARRRQAEHMEALNELRIERD